MTTRTIREGRQPVCRRRSLLRAWVAAPLRLVGDLASRLIEAVLARLGRYRTLRAEECADARFVFGHSIDLRRVRVALPGPLHRLLFALQRLLQGGRRARPFVTGWLVHVPPGAVLERAVFIHELTHVWQAQVYGPRYMWQALHAQWLGAGYDYTGYDEAGTSGLRGARACDAAGEGGQEALRRRSFFSFNREQQAQIVMHYFVRRVLRGESEDACAAWAAHVRTVRETEVMRVQNAHA